jgi:signal transduction histidine kinase
MKPPEVFLPPAPRYAYAPVSLRATLERHDEAGPRRLLALWALALGPIALSALPSLGLDVMEATVAGLTLYLTLYLPLAACVPLALWFGWAWGAVPAFAAGLTLALVEGLPTGWALAAAAADPVGLGVLVLAYQAAPASTTLRSPTALAFFAVAAFVAVLTSSAGAFVWARATGAGPGDTLAMWQGWWLGSFALALLLTAPLMMAAGPAVERWKRAARLRPHRPERLSPIRLGVAFGGVVAAFSGYVFMARHFGWQVLGPALPPDAQIALQGLSLLQWITFLFVGMAGFFGYQVARGWSATADELTHLNDRLRGLVAERELQQARLAEFAVAQEQAARARDTFFSIISHDLRGPMGALLGLSEVAENRLAGAHSDHELVEMAGLMHRSAENLYGLLVNLLEWARLQTGQMRCRPEPLDLRALVDGILNVLAGPAAEKGVFLVNRVPPGTTAAADPTMMRSVLLNLCGNGLKFTPPGGSVTVRAEPGEGRVGVGVEDTGVGMCADDVARLFKIEQTRSRTGTAGERGSGLGLILCREMVERHGGELVVESAPGAGSTFRFSLPPVTDIQAPAEEEALAA